MVSTPSTAYDEGEEEDISDEVSLVKYRRSHQSALHRAYGDDPRYRPRPQHLTKSFVHHDERPPVAASLVDGHDQQPVPSEAT